MGLEVGDRVVVEQKAVIVGYEDCVYGGLLQRFYNVRFDDTGETSVERGTLYGEERLRKAEE